MIPNIAFLTQCFEQFNQAYFHDELPAIPIYLSNAKTFLGKFCFTKHRSLFGKITYTNLCLRINQRMDAPAEMIEDIVIHEMIHYYIHYKHISDTSAHGKEFRKIMNYINNTYGRHIAISYHDNEVFTLRLYSQKIKPHTFCLIQMTNGKQALKMVPCNEESIIRMHHLILKHFKPIRIEWFYSTDIYFNRYPTSNALRLYIVSDNIEPHLQNATRLHCDATTFRIELPH